MISAIGMNQVQNLHQCYPFIALHYIYVMLFSFQENSRSKQVAGNFKYKTLQLNVFCIWNDHNPLTL